MSSKLQNLQLTPSFKKLTETDKFWRRVGDLPMELLELVLNYEGRLYAYKISHLSSTMTDEYLGTIGEQILTLRNPQDLGRLLATLDQQFASPPSVRLSDRTESHKVNLFKQVTRIALKADTIHDGGYQWASGRSLSITFDQIWSSLRSVYKCSTPEQIQQGVTSHSSENIADSVRDELIYWGLRAWGEDKNWRGALFEMIREVPRHTRH
jgi:hypothetical protein